MRVLLGILLISRLALADGAPSTTHLWAPVYPQGGTSTGWAVTNDLRCVEWIPEIGITNAVSLLFYETAGLGAGAKCGAAIYNGNGTTEITTTGAQDCSGSGVVGNTSLPAFSITGGTKYLICTCASTNGGGYMTTDPGQPAGSPLTALANSITPTIGLDAANACTAGAPPVTTGALSAVQTPGIFLLLATGTP